MRVRANHIALSAAACLVAAGGLAYAAAHTATPDPGEPAGARASGATGRPALRLRLSPRLLTVRPGGSERVRIVIAGRSRSVRVRPARRSRVKLTLARRLPPGVTARLSSRITASRRATLTVRATHATRLGTYPIRLTARQVPSRGARHRPRRSSAVLTLIVVGEPTTSRPGTTTPVDRPPKGSPDSAPPAQAPPGEPGAPPGEPMRLAPGSGGSLDASLANPFGEDVDVTVLEVAIVAIGAPNATALRPCGPVDFVAGPYTGPPIRLQAGATRSLEELDVPRRLWPTIAMVDRPVNQDGCKGAQLTLRYRTVMRSLE